MRSFQLDKLMTSDSEIAALRSTIIMRKVKSTRRLPSVDDTQNAGSADALRYRRNGSI